METKSPEVMGEIERQKSDGPLSQTSSNLPEIDKQPSRFSVLIAIRELTFFVAAIAGIAAVIIWVSESADREEERILRKIQLSVDGFEILSRSARSKVDASLISPTDVEVGLGLVAIGRSVGTVQVELKNLDANCLGQELAYPLVITSKDIKLSNCDIIEGGGLEIAENESFSFSYGELARSSIAFSNSKSNLKFLNSQVSNVEVSFPDSWEGSFTFQDTEVQNLKIILSRGGRARGLKDVYSFPKLSKDVRFYSFSPSLANCELIDEVSNSAYRHREYVCP